jgi:uncharacterized membrane protein YccF (DUF307 family)
LPFGRGYPSIGFKYSFCPFGKGALMKTHVTSKSQLLKTSIAVRAKITLNITCEAVGEKELKSEVLFCR